MKEQNKVKEMIPMRPMLLVGAVILAAGLLAGCADNRPLKYSTIHEAAKRGDLEDVKRHLRRGAAVNARQGRGNTPTPLYWAAGEGHIKVADFLIKNGADVNVEPEIGYGVGYITPLHAAAGKGHTEMVKLLIKSGADVNADGGIRITPLDMAAKEGHTEIVQLLRKHGAKE